MTTATAPARTSFTFAAAGRDFTLVRNANDHYAVLDAAGTEFTQFSYGGDPEDSFELEDAAVAAVGHRLAS